MRRELGIFGTMIYGAYWLTVMILVYSWKFLVYLSVSFSGVLGFYWKKAREEKPTHGDAHFATWDEVKKTVHAQPNGWYMGLLDNHRVFAHHESCLIGVAPRRTGKSNMAKAQIMAQGSRPNKPDIIVFDPHGDLRPATREFLLKQGYEEQYLDFETPSKSMHHNPLSYVRSDPMYQRTDLSLMMKLVQAEDKKSNSDHFTDFPRVVMAGMIAYMMRVTPGKVYMHELVALMLDPDKRKKVLDDMRKHGGPVESAAAAAYQDAGEKERGSFNTTSVRKMEFWLDPAFERVCGKEGFTWEATYLNSKPVVTYITTGAGDGHSMAARLVLGNAMNTRLQMWPKIREDFGPDELPAFPKELRIVLDEPRLLGRCEALTTAVTEAGKMGVTVAMWLLSLRDLFDIYPDASVIWNSCEGCIFGGGKEMSTYEDFSRMVGEKTIENPGYSASDHGESQSVNEQARRVAKSDEIRRLDPDYLVAVMGAMAFKLQKPTYVKVEGEKKILVYR